MRASLLMGGGGAGGLSFAHPRGHEDFLVPSLRWPTNSKHWAANQYVSISFYSRDEATSPTCPLGPRPNSYSHRSLN